MLLADLLLDLFTVDELRRIVRYLPQGDRLIRELPAGSVAPRHFADAVVDLMDRHGRVGELLQAVAEARPRRAAELAPFFSDAAPASAVVVAPTAAVSPSPVPWSGPSSAAGRSAGLPRPCPCFISYSTKDRLYVDELLVALNPLVRQGYLATWTDHELRAGETWEASIAGSLEAARLVLLCVSPDFQASTWCYDREMTRAIERQAVGEARVVPIFLRPADHTDAPYMRFQGLPAGGMPVTQHPDRDVAWLSVVKGIRALF